MNRSCRRNACSAVAVASLTFRYATAQAWLGDLARHPEPQCWDLCPAHADALTVPVGWELVDVRSVLDDGPATGQSGSPKRNRYAELSARLPELAAEVSAQSPLHVVL